MQWYPIPAVCALDCKYLDIAMPLLILYAHSHLLISFLTLTLVTVGGIVYNAVPFNGWYANTEVVRDITDECRLNMLVPIGKALGMETDTKPGEAPLWKDEAMHILSSAVYHSFKTAKVNELILISNCFADSCKELKELVSTSLLQVEMVDHHTLIDMFWDWYRDEMKSRKFCPVNYKVCISYVNVCFVVCIRLS